MQHKYTSGDLKIELSDIGNRFSSRLALPLVAYDYLVDRLMQSSFQDRENENYVNILIFHTLSKIFKDQDPNGELKDTLYDIATAMTLRLVHIGILMQLPRENPLPLGLDPHSPITSPNTIPHTSTLSLKLINKKTDT